MYTNPANKKYMTNTFDVQKDLIKVFAVMAFIAIVLVAIKMYDAKTNEVGKIGEFILSKYVN
jgi:hypothetical protein